MNEKTNGSTPGSSACSGASRRDFMKTTAVLSTAAIAANLGIASKAFAAGSLSSTVGSEAWNSRDLKSRPH